MWAAAADAAPAGWPTAKRTLNRAIIFACTSPAMRWWCCTGPQMFLSSCHAVRTHWGHSGPRRLTKRHTSGGCAADSSSLLHHRGYVTVLEAALMRYASERHTVSTSTNAASSCSATPAQNILEDKTV